MKINNDFYTVIYDAGENYFATKIVNGKTELKEFIQSLFNNLDEQERESCLRKFNIFKGLNLSYCYVPTKMAIIDGKETIYVELKGWLKCYFLKAN